MMQSRWRYMERITHSGLPICMRESPSSRSRAKLHPYDSSPSFIISQRLGGGGLLDSAGFRKPKQLPGHARSDLAYNYLGDRDRDTMARGGGESLPRAVAVVVSDHNRPLP